MDPRPGSLICCTNGLDTLIEEGTASALFFIVVDFPKQVLTTVPDNAETILASNASIFEAPSV